MLDRILLLALLAALLTFGTLPELFQKPAVASPSRLVPIEVEPDSVFPEEGLES